MAEAQEEWERVSAPNNQFIYTGRDSQPLTQWPGHVETADIPLSDVLTVEQKAREAALYSASAVLERKGPMGNVTPGPVRELVALANFILDGEAGL